MSSLVHTLALFASILLAYVWLSVDSLQPYSLQIFALTTAIFFIVKRLGKAKFWHIAPEHASLEITLSTLAFLLLIGATGNVSSVFFPLSFVHLLFLVLACRPITAITTTALVVLFHLGLAGTISLATLQTLAALPIVLLIFLFAKTQYDEAGAAKAIVADEAQNLEETEQARQSLEQFLTTFLQPRMQTLAQGLENNAATKELATQLSLMNSEINKLLTSKPQPTAPEKEQ